MKTSIKANNAPESKKFLYSTYGNYLSNFIPYWMRNTVAAKCSRELLIIFPKQWKKFHERISTENASFFSFLFLLFLILLLALARFFLDIQIKSVFFQPTLINWVMPTLTTTDVLIFCWTINNRVRNCRRNSTGWKNQNRSKKWLIFG